MIFWALTISAFLTLSINGQKLHEFMTKDDIKLVFNRNPDDMDKEEYEVVTLHHSDDKSSRNSRVQGPRSAKIYLTAFSKDYVLYVEEKYSVLAGEKTPLIVGYYDANSSTVKYARESLVMPKNIKFYHDLKNKAAFTIHSNANSKIHVNGLIGHDTAIRSLPDHVYDLIGKNFSTSTFSSYDSTSRSYSPTYHVIIKTKDKNFDSSNHKQKSKNLGNEINTNEIQTPEEVENTVNKRMKNHKTQKTPKIPSMKKKTVYPQILVVVDYDTYELHSKNLVSLAQYMLAFWNAVDLRFREMIVPRVRLNIAGIVVPTDRKSASYFESIALDQNTTLLTNKNVPEFGKYFLNPSYNFPEYDIIVGHSPKELKVQTRSDHLLVYGLASGNGAACETDYGYSTAFFEDDGAYSHVVTAAHEVGHLLGAPHDGEGSKNIPGGPCTADDGYIMIGDSFQNWNRWSSCSIEGMRGFLSKKKASCLRNKPAVGRPFSKILPGRLLTRDEQCQKRWGSGAKADKSQYNNCLILHCENEHWDLPPAEGTYCGKKQICLDGQCVNDPEIHYFKD